MGRDHEEARTTALLRTLNPLDAASKPVMRGVRFEEEMKTIGFVAALVLVFGCSSSPPPRSISQAEAAERAWAAMETAPANADAIAGLMEKKKLRVEQVESAGRHVWRVMRTDAPQDGVLVPVRPPRPTDAIAAPPQTPWVAAVDVSTGEIVWKHRNRTR